MRKLTERSAKRWISYSEAQEITGLSRGTIWKILGENRGLAAKVGRRVLIDAEALDRHLIGLARGEER